MALRATTFEAIRHGLERASGDQSLIIIRRCDGGFFFADSWVKMFLPYGTVWK